MEKTFVSELDPRQLWQHFDHILTIPRGSKNEHAMRQYVIEVARRNNLQFRQDEAGNVVVARPGANGGAPTVLQSHLDMVNEKNADVEHDFETDPIRPVLDGEYLRADGTTLGSDNGIGVAAALAVLESDSTAFGPIECLFTVDEETGLTGASQLGTDLLEGRRLINLDTEEEGALYVGCAGGIGINVLLPLISAPAGSDTDTIKVSLRGLKGGHSGVDIHLQRGNAIKLLARMLNTLWHKLDFDLAGIRGGNMHNAIPREAFATLVVPHSQREEFDTRIAEIFEEVRAEYRPAEPGMDLHWEGSSPSVEVFETDTQATVLGLLNALPHGVMSMSYDIEGLVETSANLATVRIEDSTMHVHVSNRSSVDSAIFALQERVDAIGRLAGAETEWEDSYPGWKPDMESEILRVATQAHRDVLGSDPEIKAIHAGLECGIIKEKYPAMDMVSLGPQIEFPHSPDERVRIPSVADFYRLLTGVLERLAGH